VDKLLFVLTGWLSAARSELLQRRREFSLDVEHSLRFGQIRLQARILLAHARQLTLTRVGWGSATRATQRHQRAFFTLSAPFGDRRGVYALTPKRRASTVSITAFVFSQDS
jgi:hypothetical protein